MTLLRLSSEEPQGPTPQPKFICEFISRAFKTAQLFFIPPAAGVPACRRGRLCRALYRPAPIEWPRAARGNVLSRSVGKLSGLNLALCFHAI